MALRTVQARLDRASGSRRLRRRPTAIADEPRPDPRLSPGVDRVPRIEHIVLLMMENHSFDNYIGRLGRGDGLPEPAAFNPTLHGTVVESHHFGSTKQTVGAPSQSWRSSHIQYNEGGNDGFAVAVEDAKPGADPALSMGYWDETDLPFYYGLARTFPLADRWFSSCLGPTFPNRRFLMAATADGLIDDAIACIIDYPRTGTIFDLLNRFGVPWVNYHHVPTIRLWRKQLFARPRRIATLALAGLLPQVDLTVRGEIRSTTNIFPLGLFRTIGHLRHIERFFSAAATGNLPAVSIVDPDFEHGSEENPQDIQIGESFAADVIDAVMHGPAWPRTLLLWFYDEHGGYYDHVPPPEAVVPDHMAPRRVVNGQSAWDFVARQLGFWKNIRHEDAAPGGYDRYGFRVPAVLISPYARPDFVSSTVFDHTSALKLIEEKWNLPSLTHRDAAATAPWEMLDLEGPPTFLSPPSLPSPAVPHLWRSMPPMK